MVLRQRLVAGITRLYPFLSGCGTFANKPIIRALAGSSNEVAWARVARNTGVYAPLDDYVGRAVFYVGDLDRKITWICRRLVRAGDTVLDIGANIGLVTMKLAALVGPMGRVHAFEPNPSMCDLLQASIQRNGFTNVSLYPFALGAHESQLELFVPRGHAGKASLIPGADAMGTRIEVPVKTLSSVLAGQGITRIRLVKIDVEGFEPDVLAGAREHFSMYPPQAILFELNDPPNPIGSHPTIQVLRSLQYKFFSIPKALIRLRPREFDPERETGLASHDFVAIHEGEECREIVSRLVR
jgi:FkbM family methyltransferase